MAIHLVISIATRALQKSPKMFISKLMISVRVSNFILIVRSRRYIKMSLVVLRPLFFVVFALSSLQFSVFPVFAKENEIDVFDVSSEEEIRKKLANTGLDADGQPFWVTIQKGLEFCEFRPDSGAAKISVLKIDPEYFDFALKSSGEDGRPPRSLEEWSKEYNLVAAINASMYLPDSNTSTGYMRMGKYVNNPRIMDRFGAFFVAGPRHENLPGAQIVDRENENWRNLLDDYDLVIQNYRMTNANRRILWAPGGPLYAISAIAQDGSGKILFLHSERPIEAYDFVQQILHLPLDARVIMYVEGGAQAGLLIHSEFFKRDLGAPHTPSFLVTGNLKAVLPNILGISPKKNVAEDH